MKHHLKFPKQLSFIQFLLLFPVVGLLDLKRDIKNNTIDEFTTLWVFYLFLTALWCAVVGGLIYILCTRPAVLFLPVVIILGIVFLLIGIPRILYRLFNRKHKK